LGSVRLDSFRPDNNIFSKFLSNPVKLLFRLNHQNGTSYTQKGRFAMDAHRAERISEALREELNELISYELSDPRIGEAVVTEVLVSPDKKHAQVRLHLANPSTENKETIAALEGARSFLRRQLAERLNMFRVPELHFEADVSVGLSSRMDYLLKRVRRGRPRE
jgi:ribosome-binding factor A